MHFKTGFSLFIFMLMAHIACAKKDLAIAKGDTIKMLPVRSEVFETGRNHTADRPQQAYNGSTYVYEKSFNILKGKYKVLKGSSTTPFKADQILQLEDVYKAFDKSDAGEIEIPALLKPVFWDSSTRFQLFIAQYGEYSNVNQPGHFSNNTLVINDGYNLLYFLLADRVTNKIIYFKKSKTGTDARNTEQTDRQIHRCLKGLYYN